MNNSEKRKLVRQGWKALKLTGKETLMILGYITGGMLMIREPSLLLKGAGALFVWNGLVRMFTVVGISGGSSRYRHSSRFDMLRWGTRKRLRFIEHKILDKLLDRYAPEHDKTKTEDLNYFLMKKEVE